MNQTEYLNLNKPGYENLADIEVLNENFEKIDKNAQQGAINLEDHLKVKSTQEKDGHMSKEDKKKIDGIAPGANNYIHPNTPSIRHVSDEEKSDWNNKEPGIIKKNAFNKDFGTTADSVLEGAKLAELLGCDYGGILNNSNLKTKGLAYYCTANKSLYRCKKDTDLNYANLDYFEGYSHSDFASKLENLVEETNAEVIINYGGGTGRIYLSKTFNTIVDFRLHYNASPPMITEATSTAVTVGTIPIGFIPRLKYVTPLVNRGEVVGTLMMINQGSIVIQSCKAGITIADNMEIGGTYFSI
ncbi:MAG: hypothetical protein ACRC54_04980 [Fusobacteriaceae bacterium]